MVGSFKVSWTSWKSSSGWFERRPSGEEKVSAACSRLLCSHPLLRQLLCRGISYLIIILSFCFSIFIFISFTTALLCQIIRLIFQCFRCGAQRFSSQSSYHYLVISSILYFIFSYGWKEVLQVRSSEGLVTIYIFSVGLFALTQALPWWSRWSHFLHWYGDVVVTI